MGAFGEVTKNYCSKRKGPRHGLQFDLIISLALKIRDLLSPRGKGSTRIKPATITCIPSAHQAVVAGCGGKAHFI